MVITISNIKGNYFFNGDQKVQGIYENKYILFKGERFNVKESVSFGSYKPVEDNFVLVQERMERVKVGDLTAEEYQKEYLRLCSLCNDDTEDMEELLKHKYNRDLFFFKYENAESVYEKVINRESIQLQYEYFSDPIDVPFTTPMRLANADVSSGELYQLKFSAKQLLQNVLDKYEESTGIHIKSHYTHNIIDFDKYKDKYINYQNYIQELPKDNQDTFFTVSAIGTEQEVKELYENKFTILYNAFSSYYRIYHENRQFSEQEAFNTLCTIERYLNDMNVKIDSINSMRDLKKYISERKNMLVNAKKEV